MTIKNERPVELLISWLRFDPDTGKEAGRTDWEPAPGAVISDEGYAVFEATRAGQVVASARRGGVMATREDDPNRLWETAPIYVVKGVHVHISFGKALCDA